MTEFKVWCPDDEDIENARPISAFDHEHAAELWAEESDCASAEYKIASGHTVVVMVQADDGGAPVEFFVEGEAVPSYRAYRRVK